MPRDPKVENLRVAKMAEFSYYYSLLLFLFFKKIDFYVSGAIKLV